MQDRLHIIILSLLLLTAGSPSLPASALQVTQEKMQTRDKNGNTPLIRAVRSKNIKQLKQLLSAGADPNLKRTGRDQYYGWNALMFALHNKDLPSIKLLLKYKASPDGPMKTHFGSGWTPLMYAIETQQSEAALSLISAGAKIEERNDYSMQSIQEGGITALTLAIRHENNSVARALVERGADFLSLYDAPNGEESALSEALASKQLNLVHLMLRQKVGARPGPNACSIAAQYGIYKALKYVPNSFNKKDCQSPLRDGSNAFLWAAYQGDLQMLMALKYQQANIHVQDQLGKNAFDYALAGLQDTSSAYAPRRQKVVSAGQSHKLYQQFLNWGIRLKPEIKADFQKYIEVEQNKTE